MKVLDSVMGGSRPCVRCGRQIVVAQQNTAFVDPRHRTRMVKRRIGELLVSDGLLSETQLADALAQQKRLGGRIVENLIALEFIDPETFLNFLSRQPGIASIDLLNYVIPDSVITIIPREFALRHEVLPLDKMGDTLTVGMACPLDSQTLKELQEITGLKVKPLLVSMDDVRQALRRYHEPPATAPAPTVAERRDDALPVPEELHPEDAQLVFPRIASALTFEGVIRLVQEVKSLPALPETVTQVRQIMHDPKTTARDVSAIIARDPALTAKVLSLSNSAAYGFLHRVDSIELATTLLGLREIYGLVLSSAVVDYLARAKSFDYKAFWLRSMICATATKRIAKALQTKDAVGIFAAGLLHDLGRAILAEVAPERYAALDDGLADDAVIEREHRTFGLAHPEIGYILAEEWKLPPEFAEPMRYHSRVQDARAMPQWVAIVGIAQHIADYRGFLPDSVLPELEKVCAPAAEVLSLNRERLREILELNREIDIKGLG
jgi:HD-like signal output (HDOD) protein